MSVQIYDTTLRDGLQGEGVTFSVDDKIRIVKALDDLGIDFVEGGWPGSNPKDQEFYGRMEDLPLRHATLAAFGSTRRANNRPENDQILLDLLAAHTQIITIFGKTWKFHVSDVLRISYDQNLKLIEDSIAFLKSEGRRVFYDAEHFFDGYKDDPEYALATLDAATRGGAETLILCDTNGGTLPLEAMDILAAVQRRSNLSVGVHIHNDTGMAAAISVLAAQQGAAQIQGTFNGYGERCGNANLSTILPTLILKLGLSCQAATHLTRLTSTSRLISELSNLHHDERQPYVGASAFAHKAGMHVDAVTKNTHTQEHILPASVGNERRFLLSDQAGRSTILSKAQELVPSLTKESPEISRLTKDLKSMEHKGYSYEAAEASFELLIKKAFNLYEKVFKLEGFRIIVEKRGDNPTLSEATIKVSVDGEEEITAAEGEGPVNALDSAIRKALCRFYPELRGISLSDYKVRVLDDKRGTAAKVRVLIETSDGRRHWSTVGVSENIIEASWQALVDGIEYGILREKDENNANQN
ncbi:MAG TPA: citramalate synthase [Bacillota bacterium]|nr:citramalate synthase [Bacillota bacterium]